MVDSLRRFPVVAGFDEVANRNRIGAVRSCPLNQSPRHVGSGGVRFELVRSIDLPAFAGQRWGSPTRTSLRECLMTMANFGFLLGIGMPGLPEMLVVGFIVLLLFGGKKLPSLMRNLGRSTNEFKRGMTETAAEDEQTPSSDESN